jgi:diaminopimelate epimerase
MGAPALGRKAVNALPGYGEDYEHNGRSVSRVFALANIDPTWTRSVLVSVDNPHCVTFLETEAALLSFDDRQPELAAKLITIADREAPDGMSGHERPFADGINLQWAFVRPDQRILARVFERGEGWTRSSGSSATAVAWAVRHLGLTAEAIVCVEMLGGAPTILFDDRTGRARYFGVAIREDKLKADPPNSLSER